MLNRQPDHVLLYVATELNTDAVLGAEQELILKGSFMPKDIEKIIKTYIGMYYIYIYIYIVNYVNCKMCSNTCTTLNKDPATRSYTMHCSYCESTRSVTIIKSNNFRALNRGERRKQRNVLRNK